MMPSFIGFISPLDQGREKRVVVTGATLKEAIANAGYIPLNQAASNGRLAGKLTTGQRFGFRLSPAKPSEINCNDIRR